MDKNVKKLNAENTDVLQKFLGAFDENVNQLMQELGVIIRVDGVKVVVSGAEERVNLAAEVVENLLELAGKGEDIDRGRVTYCVELAKEGKAKDITKLASGTVAITSRGKPIKCKTVGQPARERPTLRCVLLYKPTSKSRLIKSF